MAGPAPVTQGAHVFGFQHEVEWGVALVGIRPNITPPEGLAIDFLQVQTSAFFFGEGVALLQVRVGTLDLLVPGGALASGAKLESPFTFTRGDPVIAVFRVDALVAQVNISMWTALPEGASVHFETRTLDLMPLDHDPRSINFQRLLWPTD